MGSFTKHGFFSAVYARKGDGKHGQPVELSRIVVRARVRGHLKALKNRFPDLLGLGSLLPSRPRFHDAHQGRRRPTERPLGRPCRVVMDLAGPKLRTGPLEPGPEVVRIRPQRDVYGRIVAPARV